MKILNITDFNNSNVNVAQLIQALTTYDWSQTWIKEVEFIYDYVPEVNPNAEPKRVVIRHKKSGAFLRWSKGPIQGYFWDCYGEDFELIEWALVAISQAPIFRNCNPIEFKIPVVDKNAG